MGIDFTLRKWKLSDAQSVANNAGSRGVLEKAGFKLEGILRKSIYKNGEILDSCLYAICI